MELLPKQRKARVNGFPPPRGLQAKEHECKLYLWSHVYFYSPFDNREQGSLIPHQLGQASIEHNDDIYLQKDI